MEKWRRGARECAQGMHQAIQKRREREGETPVFAGGGETERGAPLSPWSLGLREARGGTVPGNGWLAGWLGRHERNTREHEYARREISAVP